MTIYYTGIGSRETPAEILSVMEDAAFRFGKLGFVLRSGKASGADGAFQRGLQNFVKQSGTPSGTLAEIYIPWNGFKGDADLEDWWDISLNHLDILFPEQSEGRNDLLSTLHPNYEALKQKRGAFALHSRNIHQMLGPNLDSKRPSNFCVYYAKTDKAGNPKGGTATAVKLGIENGVKCLNLFSEGSLELLQSWIEKLEEKSLGKSRRQA